MAWIACPLRPTMKNAVQIEGLKRNNIGDVLQAVAVADHLPETPLVLDRENLPSASNLGPLLFSATAGICTTT